MYRYNDPDPAKRRAFCDWIMAQKPKSVAMIAMGPSSREYFIESVVLEGHEMHCDEVWSINGGAMSFRHDRNFNMHDLRHFANSPGGSRLAMAMTQHDRPIITTTAYPEFPTSYAFPLQDVINATGENYLNSTVAYALAYAVALGVKDIWLYGCDFWYPDLQRREQGGQCAAYWLGMMRSFGVNFHLPQTTSLLDAHEVKEYSNANGQKFVRRPFYGYEPGTWREDLQEYANLGAAQNPRNGPAPRLGGVDGGGAGTHQPGNAPDGVHGGPAWQADADAADLDSGRGAVLGQRRPHQGNGSAGLVLGRGGQADAPGPEGLRAGDAGGGG